MLKVGRFSAIAASVLLLSVVWLLPLASRAVEAARPNTAGYPAVGDLPPRSDKPAMTADEQSKLKKELSAARDRQVPRNNAKSNKGKANSATSPVKP